MNLCFLRGAIRLSGWLSARHQLVDFATQLVEGYRVGHDGHVRSASQAFGPSRLIFPQEDNAGTAQLATVRFLHDALEDGQPLFADGSRVENEGVERLRAEAVEGANGVRRQEDAIAEFLEFFADFILQLDVGLGYENRAHRSDVIIAAYFGLAFQVPPGRLDGVEQLRRRLVAPLRVERHHGLDEREDGGGRVHFLAFHRGDVVEALPLHASEAVARDLERRPARQRLVEHAAEKVDVAAHVARLDVGRLFQAGIVDSALDSLAVLHAHRRVNLGQPEIDELGRTLAGNEDVSQLDVAVS